MTLAYVSKARYFNLDHLESSIMIISQTVADMANITIVNA